MIYDGEIMIAKEGELLKYNELLSFKNFNLVTWNDEDDKTFLTKRPTDKNIEFHKAASLALFDYLRKLKAMVMYFRLVAVPTHQPVLF